MKHLRCFMLLSIFVLCVLLYGTACAGPTSGSCGENLTWSYSNGILTISGSGDMNNYSYSEAPWYDSRSSITKVIINNGVTSIGSYAFGDCSITSISIASSVTSIGNYAFNYCEKLPSITIPNSIRTIGEYAFSGCRKLESVTIPKSVISIGDSAFVNCYAMTCINVNSENEYYCSINGALYSKDASILIKCPHALNGSYSIPMGVETIREWAFYYCKNITKVVIPGSVTSIESSAFSSCINLNTVVYIGTEAEWNNISIGIYNNSLNEAEKHFLTAHAKVDATCETAGTEAYWNCSVCNKYFSDANATTEIVEPIVIQATGHTLTAHAKVDATCEAAGAEAYWSCSVCNKLFKNSTATIEIDVPVVISALGHEWGAATYTWSTDSSKVTATRVCAHDAEHLETETVTATSEMTLQPTCESMGETTYTSGEFQNAAFAVQSKTLTDVPALGHSWGEPTYAWNEENTEVTATRICENDAEHTETETVPVTSEITKQPACTEMGETTYTSGGFQNAAFTAQSKTLTNVNAIGHEWGEPEYTWSEDNTALTAAQTCTHDASHIRTETVAVQRIVTVSPTKTTEGAYKFVSETFEIDTFAVQEKAGGTIPALDTLSMPTFPASLRTIEDEAFEGTRFQAVIIPDTVTTIGNHAFANCRYLVYVRIPASVTTIAPDAFADCPNVIIERVDE